TSVNATTKIGLLAGTKIEWNQPGQVTSFTLENNLSYIQLSAPIKFGPQGQILVQELDGDVVLAVGPSQIMLLGNGITGPAGNQLHVKAKIVFGPHGAQVTGLATVGVNITGTPVSFTINFSASPRRETAADVRALKRRR